MSLPEIGFRTQQFFQKRKEKRRHSFDQKKAGYDKILHASIKSCIDKIPFDLAQEFFEYENFQFFGYSININDEIDWHLDISSGKTFPLSFSKDIDDR